mgnify:CR=1 FL=1
MKKTRLIALLLAVVLCIGLLPVSAGAATAASVTWIDGVDTATGKLSQKTFTRDGEYAESSADSTTWSVKYYIVQKDQTVTIRGDLTLTDKAMIILCENSKLIVTGSLILNSRESHIYGQTSEAGETGTLIVQNTKNAGAAVRSESGESLYIDSGKLELDGGTSGQITDGKAALHSNSKITKGTLDGKALKLNEWDGKEALAGSKLVLEYCDHDDEDTKYVHDEGTDTHHLHCDACGLDYGSESCNFDGGDVVNAGAEGHYRTCWCGNKESTTTPHTPISVPTEDGKKHTSGCQYCGYTSGDPESHKWDHATGKCTVCGFQPVATDDQNALYESVDEALKSGSDKIYLFSQKTALDPINGSVTFNAPGKTVTLDMDGYTLESSNTVLTVEAGTLTLTGADGINIVQNGRRETAAPAIEVTGGKLIVDGNLTAEGGFAGSGVRQPAIKATGGELELNGSLNLKGGLTLQEPAKLNTPLTQGVFWAENHETLTYRVDLRGNNASKPANHPDLESILEDGYIFVMSDKDGNPVNGSGESVTKDNYTFYSPATNLVGANVTIVPHEHSYHQLTNSVAPSVHACDCGKSEDHTFENGVCTVCSYVCQHDDVHPEADDPNTFKCARCKMTMVARSEKDGATTYYSDLKTALKTAETGSTITLLADAAPRGADIYGDSTTRKVLTLNLNGHSVTSEAFTISIGEKCIPYPGKNEYYPATLKIIGTGDLKAPIAVTFNSTLDLSEWTGAHIQYVGVNNEGSVLIGPSSAAATIGKLSLSSWGYGKQGTLRLSGGAIGEFFNNSFDDDNKPTYPYGSFLLPGYAFKQNGAYLNYTDVLPYREEVYNLSVVPCPHGALTTDASGALHCGYCNADMSGFAAEITCKDGSTGYSSDPHADGFYNKDVVKVKMLKDFDDSGVVNHAMTIDLNGKTIKSLSITAAGVKIIDSAETKGTIGTLTVTADGVTLRDLLADGYGFRSTDGTWVAEGAATASNVTIAEAPIQDVFFYEGAEKKENEITALTKTYGEEAALYAHWSSDGQASVAQKWEVRSGENGSWKLLKDAGGTSCTVPAFAYAGTYTYRFTVTAEGYSKSAEITVTVNKTDIANTEVGLMGKEIMFTPDPRTGAGTEVSAQVTGISFKTKGLTEGEDYTVSGNTGTNVGDYELTITAAPGSKKFTGTKKVSWKITPFTLGYFKLPWSIEKDYDGTTALPNKPRDWFTDGFENRTTLLPESSTIYLKAGNLYTYSATYVDANAGEGKEINATFHLESDNYRFASDLTGVSADGKTLTLENWQNGYPKFNINKIDMPNFDKTVAATVVNDLAHTYEIALPALPALTAPHEYGTITYAVESKDLENGYKNATAQIVQDGEQYKLSLTVPAVKFAREESVGTITVKVTTTNYNDVTLTVNVNTTNKLQPTVTASADPNSFTYGTKLGDVKLTASATCNGHTVEGTIAWDDPADTLLDVGIYEKAWTFTPTDGSTYREVKGKLDIQVNKATLTGAPVFGKITENGKTLNDVQIDFSNILGVDGKQPVLGFDWTDDHSTVIEANKSYGWTIDAGNNYELLTGSAVLYPRSSSYSDQVKKQSEEYEAKKRGELPESDSRFTDVDESDYFFDAVEWAAENGITGGVSAERFGAALDCSRAQTMTFLWRAMGEPEPGSYDPALTDVKNGSYYYEAVLWAMQEGVTTGMGKNLFSPDATVTRGQFVTFLYRLSGAKSDAAHPFTDVPAGSYYEPAIAWAYSKGITTGTSKTTFNPDSPCTRAQIITFLYRYFNQK